MPNTSDRKFDVLCAGLIVADHVCAPIRAFPPAGGLVTTDRLDLCIGGCASNVAVDLAKLNRSVGILGRVGDDVFGRFVQDVLAGHGVSCDHVLASETAQTAATMVVNVKGEDRRFIHAVGANGEFTGLEFGTDVVKQCRVFYVGGFGLNPALSGENVAELFRTAREAGVTTMLDVVIGDPDCVREMLEPALPLTDIFLPNTDEARTLTGEEDPLVQAETFRKAGAENVIVTCGGRGVLMLSPGSTWRMPAHDVEQVDGTGGGDAFVSGYIQGLLTGAPPARCLQYGSAMGASCVRTMGATTGVFTAAELEEFVAAHPLEPQELS
ncbi:carbohydrate kinase family protein [Maioricimonas rarisocia]|nr:carbohydrate kinase family protein [Maioricimonas rarisocia]